jgi:hypothetical protein
MIATSEMTPFHECYSYLGRDWLWSMDPLSITMAVIGLLRAAQQISAVAGTIISKSKSAPKEIRDLKSSVDTIRAVLLQLQLILHNRTKVTEA